MVAIFMMDYIPWSDAIVFPPRRDTARIFRISVTYVSTRPNRRRFTSHPVFCKSMVIVFCCIDNMLLNARALLFLTLAVY